MRTLRFAAWTVFLLDLVVFAQLLYGLVIEQGGPSAEAAVRGLAMMLGSGLLGTGIVLVVSSRLHLRAGLWIALGCGAVPLLMVFSAFFQSVAE